MRSAYRSTNHEDALLTGRSETRGVIRSAVPLDLDLVIISLATSSPPVLLESVEKAVLYRCYADPRDRLRLVHHTGLINFIFGKDRPSDTRQLIGQGNGGDPGRFAPHELFEPWGSFTVTAQIRSGAQNQQLAQVAVALLGDST